ncbi:MAG: penicillin-binding protein 2, partial [Chlorobiales bacterium]|nr:penicillin-binding protein 2 [Chlorobiales bacterium]
MAIGSEHKEMTPEKRWEREQKLRTYIVVGVLFVFVGLIVIRLMTVQIVNSAEYKVKAKRQYESRRPVSAARGAIYDRDMQKLATSLTLISFAADPNVFQKQEKKPGETHARKPENPERVADSLAKIFRKDRNDYLKKLKEKGNFVWLERNVPIDVAVKVTGMQLPGVRQIREKNRYYENLAAQVIGFTDRDNNGISGIEKQYDTDLRGTDGVIIMQRTATGKYYPAVDKPLVEPVDGNGLQLTLDMNIQAIVETELKRGLDAAGAQAGIAIVMDVRTGEILAMSNQPDFDMNKKGAYQAEAVRNRAITDTYEPGSTFKLVMATAATELEIRKADDWVFAENGKYRVFGQTIQDHEKLGKVTFKMAIAQSSNIIAAKTAMAIGPEKFYEYAHAFGFGEKTGIDLIGEVRGKLKPVKDWGKPTLPWMAQGYEVQVTPLQILCAYAALANDGVLMKPYIVKKVLSPDGDVIKENKPVEVREVMSKSSARYVRNYFKTVVDSGTGMAAAIEGLEVGGKTGTAQLLVDGNYRTGSYVSSFVGFFPVNQPEIAAII